MDIILDHQNCCCIFKIWELGSGKLKLSLTGHISTVRGLAVSPRQPYLFSCGEDKQVKCWDLEYNKVNDERLACVRYSSLVCFIHPHARDNRDINMNNNYNKIIPFQVVRHYHGHLSAIYSLDLHPTIDVLVTCGRDATARVTIT